MSTLDKGMAKSTIVPNERESAFLCLALDGSTGREIADNFRLQTGEDLGYGAVYPVISRMETRGWVKTRISKAGDARMRHVIVTPDGRAALRRAHRHFSRLAKFTGDAVGRLSLPDKRPSARSAHA